MIYRNLPTFVLVFLQRSKENTEGFTIEEGTRANFKPKNRVYNWFFNMK